VVARCRASSFLPKMLGSTPGPPSVTAAAAGSGIGVRGRCAVTSRARRRSSVTQEPSASCANLPRSEISPIGTVLASGGAKGNSYPHNAHPFDDSIIQSFPGPRLPDFRSNTVR